MSLNRNPASSLQGQLARLSLQHFQSLPDELLISLFSHLSAFERTRLLSTCKRWNQVILLHTPFWQYLTVPKNLPFHLIFTILLAFTYRSGFKLRHVVIQSNIQHENELETIFAVLAKSAADLRLLGLFQYSHLNSKTRKLAMKQVPLLHSLITHSDPESLRLSVAYFVSRRSNYGIKDRDNESSGLRMYVTGHLLEVLDEDLKWLSKVNHLDVEQTDSTRMLLTILENCQDLMELFLTNWQPDAVAIEETNQNLLPNFERPKLRLKKLKEMNLPNSTSSTLALSRLLEINHSQTNLVGTVSSSLSFEVPYLKHLWIYQTHVDYLPRQGYESLKDFETAVTLLFEKNQFVEKLCLDGPYDDEPEEQREYFRVILERLCPLKQDDQRADPEESKEQERKAQDQVEGKIHQFLPYLVRLDIQKSKHFPKEPLRKILESRRKKNPEFQLRFLDELGDEVTSGKELT